MREIAISCSLPGAVFECGSFTLVPLRSALHPHVTYSLCASAGISAPSV